MIREIVKDIDFLKQPSTTFNFNETGSTVVITDLLDTAEAHKENCAGLAAVQIGELKKVIVVKLKDKYVPMINPVIFRKCGGMHLVKEGCLSLEGERQVKRSREIWVSYKDIFNKEHIEKYIGIIAQVIQHECDHLKGILI